MTLYENAPHCLGGGYNAAKRHSTAIQIGGLHINPESLANHRKGHVIDQDPTTGYRTFVQCRRQHMPLCSYSPLSQSTMLCCQRQITPPTWRAFIATKGRLPSTPNRAGPK